MTILLETRIKAIDSRRAKASFKLDFCGGSVTIAGILLRENEAGPMRITMPLEKIGDNFRPPITLQGSLKLAVENAIREDYENLRAKGLPKLDGKRTFEPDFERIQ